MEVFRNLDLFSVGITVSAIGILGFMVFLNNRRSITNKTFLFFSIITIFYGILNYLNHQIHSVEVSFFLIRLTIFFAVWHAFALFQLFYVFPNESVKFPKYYKFVILPVVALTAILTLTTFVFYHVAAVESTGQITKIKNGPGIFLFGSVVVGLIIAGMSILLRKTINAKGEEKPQFIFVLIGVFITFFLLIIFNFIFPAILDNSRFVYLGALFMFPFIILTFYSIVKHHLLSVKVITTEIVTFVLAAINLFEVIVSNDLGVLILRVGTFSLILGFGMLLIKSVIKEVEQRERLEILTKKLESVNTKLKELDKVKSEFLSFASHQVKTPMSVVKGYATLIFDGTYGEVSDKVKETARKIKDSADNMIALVNNLLDLRKIEEGKMEFKFEKTDLVKMVGDMVAELQQLAKSKNLDLSFESSIPNLIYNADLQKLAQVFQNLIDNSIKYTETGWIKVNLTANKDLVEITVSDSGRGISKELLPQLFEQFIRDVKEVKKIEGTGLGLYIAKQIVQAHHGQIWVESLGVGQGSLFHVKLPL